MSAEREMTLDEWVGRLPEFHLAHRQYTEMYENYGKLAAEIVRLRGEVPYDRELIAQMLDELSPVVGLSYIRESVDEQARLLRAADNASVAAAGTATLAPAEAKGDALLAAIAASAASAGDYQPHDQVVSMFAVESAIRGAELDTPQPASGEADLDWKWCPMCGAKYGVTSCDAGCGYDLPTTPPAAQVQGDDSEWYTSPQGSHCIDFDEDQGNMLSILLKNDGTISYAYLRGEDRGTGHGMAMLKSALLCWAAHPSACELGAVRELVALWRSRYESLIERGRLGDGYRVAGNNVKMCADELEAALQHRGDSQEVGHG